MAIKLNEKIYSMIYQRKISVKFGSPQSNPEIQRHITNIRELDKTTG